MFRYITTFLADVGCSPDGMDDCFSDSGSCWILGRACDLLAHHLGMNRGPDPRGRFSRRHWNQSP